MTSIITEKCRVQSAINFRNMLDTNNLYMFIGKQLEWDPTSSSSSSSETVPTPTDTRYQELDHWKNMIAAKKVTSPNVTHIIPRYDWTNNTVYTQYDDTADLTESEYYVMTDDLNVYKCISNNGGEESTVQPTGTSSGYIENDPDSSDGYIWKYMYTISADEYEKFANNDWIPVKYVEEESQCDENSSQYDIQQSAVPGEISNIIVLTGGSSYSSAPTVTIDGDGTGATATAIVSSNSIVRIYISNRGKGYTYATIELTGGGGSGATFRVVMSPSYGHGSNAIKELNGKYLMIRSKFSFLDSKLPSSNEYRKIGLLLNPRLKSDSATDYASEDLATGSIYDQTVNILTDPLVSLFSEDDTITQASTDSSGTVVEHVETETGTLLRLTGIVGEFDTTTMTNGTITLSSSDINSAETFSLERGIGDILHIEQRQPVYRSNDSAEDIRIIFFW